MDLATIKKYPSQITSAFKRFPLAAAFAIFTTIAFIYVYESNHELTDSKLLYWLSIYPTAATMIALTISLVQESRKKFSVIPHAVAEAVWLAISIALVFYHFSANNDTERTYVLATWLFIYTTSFLSVFVAPFFKQKDENGFWVFLMKNAKAAVIAGAISAVLLIAIEGLLFGFFNLFDIKPSSVRPFIYSAIICSCTIFPILFFSGIPSIDECLQEAPALNKFQTSANKFLFLPVISLYIILLYAYIAKIIIQWEMPKGMVSYLVSASMLLMLLRVTLTLPERINPKPSFEKTLLKILPAACIPLVILMSVGIMRRISDYGISEDRYYIAAVNIFYYIIIAILLIDKIKCKSRVIAIVFCSMFLILTNGPLSALNVTHRIWMESIETALAEQGYNKFPLNDEDSREFINRLEAKNNIPHIKMVLSRIQTLNIRGDKELAQYVDHGIVILHIDSPHHTKKQASVLKAAIRESKDNYFDIPQNVSKVSYFYKTFPQKDYEFRNDTLFFQLKPQKLDKTLKFFVTKEALEQKNVRFLETEGAKIGVEKLDVNIIKDDKKESYFNIHGFLFLE
ncbi:DUF4153 domain-containing protein [uncultured Fibrobacter sp.]|uniref:DUF4153 domain-containing protein n=1 Tax=uncultured Fibrobacter sp. TaxID=261512 RepID=UPI0025D31277|nr:DUF4153 domain-containing protein [uncultured Fibrobacter sp.]